MGKEKTRYRQTPIDIAAAASVLVFTGLISLFAIRNNDIWWLLAVARRIVESKAFITEDPFTFTVTGTPWAPQWYLSALVFYAVHAAASAWGLIFVRLLLVVAISTVVLRTLARIGVSWALASPVVLIALLNAHSRFLIRAHLFEYLFLVLLVLFLLTSRERKGKSFFVFPVVLQLLWVNAHPSFMLGPVLVVMFFGAEWLAGALSRHVPFIRPYNESGYDWRRVGALVVLMLAACLVNPSPGLFLTQPFGSEQRELVSHFTLEWRSPFDPALRHGAFHPYYEIFLGLAAVAIVISIGRLRLAPALLVAATAVLTFEAHRFRVEFALVSLPMIFVLLQASPVVESARRVITRGKNSMLAVRWAGIALSAVLIITALDRVSIGEAVEDQLHRRPQLQPVAVLGFLVVADERREQAKRHRQIQAGRLCPPAHRKVGCGDPTGSPIATAGRCLHAVLPRPARLDIRKKQLRRCRVVGRERAPCLPSAHAPQPPDARHRIPRSAFRTGTGGRHFAVVCQAQSRSGAGLPDHRRPPQCRTADRRGVEDRSR